MKRALVSLVVLALLGWVQAGFAEEQKIGYINLKTLLDDYKKVTDGEDQLLNQAEEKNEERDNMVKNIKNLREQIDLLNEADKEKKQQELDEKIKALQEFTYQTRTSLRQDRDEKFRDIMKEVKTVIEEYGKSHNYNIIIDDTLLLYKQENLDVTEEIVKILNQRYKK
ncbi:MAG: OmpH family outer membrane protein [Candidatus Omnitrophica bacterium]|nr:OmpH family outer membrane protein [Candidatus Omnitrophota bacterium]